MKNYLVFYRLQPVSYIRCNVNMNLQYFAFTLCKLQSFCHLNPEYWVLQYERNSVF